MSEPLSDIERRRLAISMAKEARRDAKIAESIAKTEARRADAAKTCGDPDALLESLRRSVAQSIGPCPQCGETWRSHDADTFANHYAAVFDGCHPNDSGGA